MNNEIEQAAQILRQSRYVVALSGAGISVESGIRPFRGTGGIWTEHGEPPMDGYQRFQANPKAHWEDIVKRRSTADDFSHSLTEAVPHPAHFALAELEEMGILRYLITQNIDNLHSLAGSRNIAEIHGNYTKLRCMECNARYEQGEISLEALPPRCPACRGVVKSDTVMFGEPIPYDVLMTCQEESNKADCMISVGTSAFVYPAAGFPIDVKQRGGRLVEFNLEETSMSPLCDVTVLGKAGETLPRLVELLKATG